MCAVAGADRECVCRETIVKAGGVTRWRRDGGVFDSQSNVECGYICVRGASRSVDLVPIVRIRISVMSCTG
jgi:hypothetical protein